MVTTLPNTRNKSRPTTRDKGTFAPGRKKAIAQWEVRIDGDQLRQLLLTPSAQLLHDCGEQGSILDNLVGFMERLYMRFISDGEPVTRATVERALRVSFRDGTNVLPIALTSYVTGNQAETAWYTLEKFLLRIGARFSISPCNVPTPTTPDYGPRD